MVSSDEINKRLQARREKKKLTHYESSDSPRNTKRILAVLALWFLGISLILQSLLWDMVLQTMYLLWGAFIIVIALFNQRGYINKTYLMILIFMVISAALFSLWYLIKSDYSYDADFIYMGGIFIIMGISTIIVYIRRETDPYLSWKDEWGF